MHMALRRMTGWIQEMERTAEEGDILEDSCALIEKNTGAQRDIFVDLSPDHKEAEELFAIARVKCGCGGNSCNQHFSYISSTSIVFRPE